MVGISNFCTADPPLVAVSATSLGLSWMILEHSVRYGRRTCSGNSRAARPMILTDAISIAINSWCLKIYGLLDHAVDEMLDVHQALGEVSSKRRRAPHNQRALTRDDETCSFVFMLYHSDRLRWRFQWLPWTG